MAPCPLRLLHSPWGRALSILQGSGSASAIPLGFQRLRHLPAGNALKAAGLRALPPFPHGLFRSLASNASSGLMSAVRYRPFRRIAPALPVFVGLGSPARTADAVGSSLPTTARPTSSVTLPTTDNGRMHAGSARRRDSLRLPPPP